MSTEPQTASPEYITSLSDPDKTGLRIFSVYDPKTGITVKVTELNPNLDLAAFLAATGARYSREPGNTEELFERTFHDPKTPEEIMTAILSYGHSSVAEMAPVRFDCEGVPLHVVEQFFGAASVGAGQEYSLRYGKIKEGQSKRRLSENHENISPVIASEIDQIYDEIIALSQEKYEKWIGILQPLITQHINEDPSELRASLSQGKIRSSIKARTLDIARMWIPLGTRTSMMYQTEIRTIGKVIREFRSSPDTFLKAFAEQIEFAFTQSKKLHPDFRGNYADLLRYTRSNDTVANNINAAAGLAGDFGLDIEAENAESSSIVNETVVDFLDYDDEVLAVMQYILATNPNLDPDKIVHFLHNLPEEHQEQLSLAIFNGHYRHNQMGSLGDIRGYFFRIKTAFAYIRDLNRHRATGRVTEGWYSSFEKLLAQGFNLNYQLLNADYLKHLIPEWEKDANELYELIGQLTDKLKTHRLLGLGNKMLETLPLGHQFWFDITIPFAQTPYFADLRTAVGGDYGYRIIAQEILKKLKAKSPLLKGLLPNHPLVDPNDADQTLGRS